MKIQTPLELSAFVRQARQQAGLTQAQLAERIGVRRLWVVRFEKGTAEVEFGTVMRALRALGIALDATVPGSPADLKPSAEVPVCHAVDLDDILTGEHSE